MPGYRCSCGKIYNPETDEFCPKCGVATPPSILSRVERKETAARLRAEGMTHYDDHCHEDDAWRGSYGAQVHREAVRSHEASLRAGYRAHSDTDVTTRGSNPTQQPGFAYPTQSTDQTRSNARAFPWKALLPFIIVLVWVLFRILGGIVKSLF